MANRLERSLWGRRPAVVVAASTVLFLAGCSANNVGSGGSPGLPGAPAQKGAATRPPGRGGGGAPHQVGQEVSIASPLVVRSGQLALEVAHGRLIATFDRVTGAAAALGGYMQSSAMGGARAAAGQASVVVRVPTAEFSALVARVDALGKVESQQLIGRDVTGQSIDLRARIANLDSEEQALRALIERAGTIPAILRVQNELFAVEGDIEVLSAEESSLINRATEATLTVRLAERAAPAGHHRPAELAVVRAAKLAGHNTVLAVRGALLAVGWSAPALSVLAVGAGLLLLRRRRGRQPSAAAAEGPG